MHYHGKYILVLGLGRSGLAATKLLQQAGAIVTIIDGGSGEALQKRARDLAVQGVEVFIGEDALKIFSSESLASSKQRSFELAVLSPGIDPASRLARQVIDQNIPLIGELELAYHFCHCPIVAITGTNGKTTTTELTVAGLQGAGLKTVACGNIGLPFSEAVIKSEELDLMVIEVSSFQLETVHQFHADIAVWLNLSPNHLDRYPSIVEYREAKLRIFRNQTQKDVVVLPKDFYQNQTSRLDSKEITFSSQDPTADFFFDGKEIYFQQQPLLELRKTQLRGAHNAENIMAALAVGRALEVDLHKMLRALCEYRAAPHRCEIVTEQNGVLWINDSKSTTLDAMEKAIQAIDINRPIILIAGGKNKGSSFASMLPILKKRVKEAILLGEMKSLIADEWKEIVSYQVNSVEEAVQLAALHAEKEDVVLLSPGTSSYDMFKNYEERGNHFKAAVKQLF